MEYKKTKPIRACLVIYFIVVLCFFAYLFFFTDVRKYLNAGRDGRSRDYSSGWTLDSGEEVDLYNTTAGSHGGSLRISKTLPAMMSETDEVCFSTSNLCFTVYVNGVEIYSYATEENMTGTGDGIAYHMIGLGTEDEGATFTIDAKTAFVNGTGGRINDMQYGEEDQYRYYVLRKNALALTLSALMLIFGILITIFYFGMNKKNPIMRPIWALGVSSILFGMWSLCDTGLPQLLTGITYATRDMEYVILHLAGFPMICFINSITRRKRRRYVYTAFLISLVGFGWQIFCRCVFGTDLHTMVVFIYSAYAAQILLMIILIVDNALYSRKHEPEHRLTFFYVGAFMVAATSAADMLRYVVGRKSSITHGSIMRFGIVIFFILSAIQVFTWWAKEKTSLERDRFINRLLQYVMDADEPDIKINKALEYLCLELHADRAYIFEEMKDGTFDNTYEFCAKGVSPEIDNLKGLPYEGVVESWYEEYEKGGHVLIYDIEAYRKENEKMYNILKPQGVNTLVTGPLELQGKRIGFFGVDNPPQDIMEEVSEIIRLLMFFLSEMLEQRDAHRKLVEYSYHDPLTETGNRRAIREFEKEELDTSRSYGFVMCDINGLKGVNDTEGHEAGDELIKSVADCLTEVFGKGSVFRMGGDEFAVYDCADSNSEFRERIEKARSMIENKGSHVAMGYSYAEGGDPDYNARRIEADNRMYDEKREFYRDKNDRRKN